MKVVIEMKDWRGNSYKEENLFKENGKRWKCEICKKKDAVRNCCEAEGDIGRTHWHGGVHCQDGGWKALCKECADIENKKWNK